MPLAVLSPKTARRALVPGLAVLALLISACGASNESDSSTTSAAPATSAATDDSSAPATDTLIVPDGTLNVSGSSAQAKAVSAWQAALQGANSAFTLNYNPNGSGGGRADLISGASAIALSDGDMSADEYAQATTTCGAAPIVVPEYISPIAIAYNLSGVSDLTLDAATLAGIWSGKITKWDDPAIAALNSGVTLPSTAITPLHRSDKSGTQKNFTDYLAVAAGSAWPEPASDAWPDSLASIGAGAEGTSGIAKSLTAGDGTIAFIDLSGVPDGGTVAKVMVGTTAVSATAEGASAAAAAATVTGANGPSDLAVQIDRATTDASHYPITLISYGMACPSYSDGTTGALVKAYFDVALSAEGQAAAAAAAKSAALADATAAAALALTSTIK